MDLQSKLTHLIESDHFLMSVIKTVEQLQLNDAWVAAGVIRNKVWDDLHNIQTNINDVDVIYYDASDLSIQE